MIKRLVIKVKVSRKRIQIKRIHSLQFSSRNLSKKEVKDPQQRIIMELNHISKKIRIRQRKKKNKDSIKFQSLIKRNKRKN